jgi:hypothetical protein
MIADLLGRLNDEYSFFSIERHLADTSSPRKDVVGDGRCA